MTAPRPEPQTEAGHTFRDDLNALGRWGVPAFITDHLADDFDEAVARSSEARAPLAARMREAVEALPTNHINWYIGGEHEEHCDVVRLYEVLALIDAAPDAAPRPEEPAE